MWLNVVWFGLFVIIIAGYLIMDGFDLGVGILHPFLAKSDEDRRVFLNSIGPVWDGNEVWLVIGGGALFAGFPHAYATVFSAFYVPFMLFVVALIFRAISIEFRSKEPMRWWRLTWDVSYSMSSVLIAGLLGILLGNLIRGIAIGPEYEFEGSTWDFLNPYALLTGLTVIALFMMHGAIYLTMKTENRLHAKLMVLVKNTSRFFVICFVTLTMSTLIYIPEMAEKFRRYPELFAVPALTMLASINIRRWAEKGIYWRAFLFSGLTSALLLGLAAIGLYPVLVPSTLNPAWDLTIQKAASSDPSLRNMLTIAAIGVPIVAAYTVFVFWTFRGKVKLDESSY